MFDKLHQYIRHVELRRDSVEDWTKYPFSIPAIAALDRLELSSPVTFMVGENGSGKSTLLEALATKAGFGGSGGSKSFGAPQRPSESSLHEHIRLARGAKAGAQRLLFAGRDHVQRGDVGRGAGRYGMNNLHEMSHGEAFLSVAMNRFTANGLYLLDEPEAALSPQRQLAFSRAHATARPGGEPVHHLQSLADLAGVPTLNPDAEQAVDQRDG